MTNPTFAQVAVNSGQPVRSPFTYEVPAGMQLSAGMAVFVPFGARVLQGIVMGFADSSPVENARPIQSIADERKLLDQPHLRLAAWLSETYLAPLWDCVAPMLPPGFGQKPVTMVSPVDIPPLLPFAARDQRILEFLGREGQVTLEALRESVPGVTLASLRKLQEAGHLTITEGLSRAAGKPRFERRLRLARPVGEAASRSSELLSATPRSVEGRLLALLAETSDVALAEARHGVGVTPKHIAHLAGEGWIEAYEAKVERDPLAGSGFETRPPPILTPQQQEAADRIAAAGGPWLVFGVTGSGKTEVYLDLARRTLDQDRSVIVLVPEISLTPQAIRRYGERFGDTLAVVHSGLSQGELYDQWFRIRDGQSRVIVGSRSALFAPAHDLGLIVIDEEHEWTYKQTDPAPRYHARDAALELARSCGATLVMGSATPDIVTFHQAETGSIGKVMLTEPVIPVGPSGTRSGQLAEIAAVDLREELAAGNRSIFSSALRNAILEALEQGEQTILFVNRRGSARFVLCRDCGHVPTCQACQVAMSLDLRNEDDPRLSCHNCGRSYRLEDRCPRCNSVRYRPFGVGTQRIEQMARTEFPQARILRWDSDTASAKGAHERIVTAVESGEVDILVGTQMLAKGLDLPAMTVVGVVDADVGLSLPDYHAHERSFQILTQVAGRAGRRDRLGQVFIQTYNPEAPPIAFAVARDYQGFYEHELSHRRRAGYPPFSRLTRLVFSHSNYERGVTEASRMASDLRQRRDSAGRPDPDILGPTPAFIARVRGRHRWQIVLRGRDPASLLRDVRFGEGWTIDVDPASLL